MIFKGYSVLGLFYKGTRRLQTKSKNIQENKTYLQYLCKYLNINDTEAQYLRKKYPVIAKLSEERIKSLIGTLNEIGLSNKVLIKEPALFGILPITLKLRYKVLRECGIQNVTPALLASYLSITRQITVGELKTLQILPAHVNVENRLAGYMTQWPTSLTTLISEDVSNTTIILLRLKIIQRYLELVLELTNEEFCRGVETYPTIKHRPLEYINETLQLLQSKVMVPNYKIKTNLYLIHADPVNLKNILSECPTLGGIDVKEIIRLHPKIALKNCQTLIEIKRLMKEYGISNEAQKRCFDIYTLSPNTIRERLEKAKTMPEFTMFYDHPRFLKMIHYNKTAIKRLTKLYAHNKKCHSLNILSGSSAHYEVFEKAPGDRLGKGKDLIFCISQSLGKKFKVAYIGKKVKRHPYWINTPVHQVKYVHEQLSRRFTDEDIFENCPIVLYPWKKVRDILNIVDKRQLHQEFPIFHENFNFDALSNSQTLSLVLYVLEKNHYFSGNGVWSEDRNKNTNKLQLQQLPNINTQV